MKKAPALLRGRTRLSRSASATTVRKDAWKTGILIVAAATLLLVSVLLLQAMLGGFGSHGRSPSSEGELEESGVSKLKIKLLGKYLGENRKLKLGGSNHGNDDVDGDHGDVSGDHGDVDGGIEDEEIEVDDSVLEGSKLGDEDDDDVDGIEEDDDQNNEVDGDESDETEDDVDDEFSQQEDDGNSDGKGYVSTNTSSNSDGNGSEGGKRLERLGQIKTLPRKSPDHDAGIVKNNGTGSRTFGRTLEVDPSFSSDDQPMEGSLRKTLEEAKSMEEVLMVRRGVQNAKVTTGTPASSKVTTRRTVFDSELERKVVKPPPLEPWNPTGSALLQDPDSIGPSALTKSDKVIFKALRRASEQPYFDQVESSEDLKAGSKELLSTLKVRRRRSRVDRRRWGYHPGLDAMPLFSEFMDEFLEGKSCEMNVFMAWNSPPWAYTVRHQRGLESLLHFHPRACVALFSETVELDFLKKFQDQGFRVAVVRPNLEELLEGTPADVFARIYLKWRKVDLFHLHYSELLRLAALYKYGGVYLDSDVIVLKPLSGLHNTVGAEALPDGTSRLNGAVMAFGKNSTFIKECLDEYTASYDEKLMDWNGADLLTRVWSRTSWNEEELKVVPSSSFFPLSASNISDYFSKVNDRDDELSKMIDEKAYTLHLWNRRTGSFVPEDGSLVARVLDQHCKWCDDVV